MSDTLLAIAAIGVALVGGLWLYGQFADASDSAIAVYGLFRNLFTAAVAVVAIATGTWIGVLGGAVLLGLAIFFGSSHADQLSGGTIERRIAP